MDREQVDAHDPMHNRLLALHLHQIAGSHPAQIPTFFSSCSQSSRALAPFLRTPHNSSSKSICLQEKFRPICKQLLPVLYEIESMAFHRSSCLFEMLPTIGHLHKYTDASPFLLPLP